MKMYEPDGYAFLRIKGEFYKVFGSWSGSYLHGDRWRVNSGITKVEKTDDGYLIHGHSGSVYKIKTESNVISAHNLFVLTEMSNHDGVEVIDLKQFLKEFNND